jgi:hypothetical protein
VVILSDLQWGDERKPFAARARRLAMSGVRFIVIGVPIRARGDGTVMDTNVESDLIAALGIDVPPWEREHRAPTTRFTNPGRAATGAEMRLLRTADQHAMVPMRTVCREAVWDYALTDTAVTRDRIVAEVLAMLAEMSGHAPQKS